ncbi:MAG: hypothetical protein ACOYLS_07630 [Polymorphobacter sp.]
MSSAIRAGLVYFALVFAIGFGLGAIRVGIVIPRVGEFVAVCLELPLMLGSAWWICRRITHALAVPAGIAARASMGATAFAALMLAELALAVLVFGRTPAQHLARYASAAALLGLAGQILFAAFPILQRRR